MSRPGSAVNQTGIRTRVAVAAAIATVVIFSAVGAIGYVAVVDATSNSQTAALNTRLDALEARLAAGTELTSELRLDASLVVVRTGESIPAVQENTLQVVRESALSNVVALVGVAPTRQIDETFQTIRRALWISIAVAGLAVGCISWLAVDRSLAPVRRLTKEAADIDTSRSPDLLPVSEAGDELADLATTFNSMLVRLRTADTDRRRFVSDAAHELRTPLMVLQADAEFAIDNGGDPKELAGSVLTQSNRLTSLTDDLLALAALDEQPAEGRSELTVADLVARVHTEHLVRPLRADHRALVVPDISRSLVNVLANAERHSASRVELAVAGMDGLVSITVDDDGVGIPASQRADVFKRFHRADTARGRNDGGAGLGLAIAHAEIGRAGGVISVGDSPLGGARFTIEVPVVG